MKVQKIVEKGENKGRVKKCTKEKKLKILQRRASVKYSRKNKNTKEERRTNINKKKLY